MNRIARVSRVLARSNKQRLVASTFVKQNGLHSFRPSNELSRLSRRSIHCTQALSMPVRRRNRSNRPSDAEGQSQDPNESPLKHEAVVDTSRFCHEASELLSRLETALAPMKEKNKTFVVSREEGEIGEILTIDLGPEDGSYRIEVSELEHVFEFTSPISGKFLYILSAETGEWVGLEDGHDFEGLLVRDLNRQCQGLPKL